MEGKFCLIGSKSFKTNFSKLPIRQWIKIINTKINFSKLPIRQFQPSAAGIGGYRRNLEDPLYVSDSSSFFFLFLIVKFSPVYVRRVISDAFIQLLDEVTGIAAVTCD